MTVVTAHTSLWQVKIPETGHLAKQSVEDRSKYCAVVRKKKNKKTPKLETHKRLATNSATSYFSSRPRAVHRERRKMCDDHHDEKCQVSGSAFSQQEASLG